MKEVCGGVQRQYGAARGLTWVGIVVAKGQIKPGLRVKTDGELRHPAGKVDEPRLWIERDGLAVIVNFNDCRLVPQRERIDAKDIPDLPVLCFYHVPF